jgi:hypothetical protein
VVEADDPRFVDVHAADPPRVDELGDPPPRRATRPVGEDVPDRLCPPERVRDDPGLGLGRQPVAHLRIEIDVRDLGIHVASTNDLGDARRPCDGPAVRCKQRPEQALGQRRRGVVEVGEQLAGLDAEHRFQQPRQAAMGRRTSRS